MHQLQTGKIFSLRERNAAFPFYFWGLAGQLPLAPPPAAPRKTPPHPGPPRPPRPWSSRHAPPRSASPTLRFTIAPLRPTPPHNRSVGPSPPHAPFLNLKAEMCNSHPCQRFFECKRRDVKFPSQPACFLNLKEEMCKIQEELVESPF